MSYAPSNPPMLMAQRIGDGPALWAYKSADPKATVVGAGYITNAGPGTNGPSLGMRVGDFVLVYDTATPTVSFMGVTAINTTTGAANLGYVAVA